MLAIRIIIALALYLLWFFSSPLITTIILFLLFFVFPFYYEGLIAISLGYIAIHGAPTLDQFLTPIPLGIMIGFHLIEFLRPYIRN